MAPATNARLTRSMTLPTKAAHLSLLQNVDYMSISMRTAVSVSEAMLRSEEYAQPALKTLIMTGILTVVSVCQGTTLLVSR